MEIADGIHLIECPHRNYFVSSCLIEGESLTLVDAGRDESPEKTIYPYIRSLGRDPSEISNVLLTHAHWDHCAGVVKILKDTGCKIGVHILGKPYIEEPGLVVRELAERFPSITMDHMANFEAVEAGFTFVDGETIDLNGKHLRVLHIPGHSACSCCIVDEEQGVYMAGDSIQGRGTGRPLIFHSINGYVDSMRHMQNEPIRTLVNGHPFPPFGRAILREDQASQHIEESLTAVDELCKLILEVLEESERPLSATQIYEATGASRPITIGCVLEALEDERRVVRQRVEEYGFHWRIS